MNHGTKRGGEPVRWHLFLWLPHNPSYHPISHLSQVSLMSALFLNAVPCKVHFCPGGLIHWFLKMCVHWNAKVFLQLCRDFWLLFQTCWVRSTGEQARESSFPGTAKVWRSGLKSTCIIESAKSCISIFRSNLHQRPGQCWLTLSFRFFKCSQEFQSWHSPADFSYRSDHKYNSSLSSIL